MSLGIRRSITFSSFGTRTKSLVFRWRFRGLFLFIPRLGACVSLEIWGPICDVVALVSLIYTRQVDMHPYTYSAQHIMTEGCEDVDDSLVDDLSVDDLSADDLSVDDLTVDGLVDECCTWNYSNCG